MRSLCEHRLQCITSEICPLGIEEKKCLNWKQTYYKKTSKREIKEYMGKSVLGEEYTLLIREYKGLRYTIFKKTHEIGEYVTTNPFDETKISFEQLDQILQKKFNIK